MVPMILTEIAVTATRAFTALFDQHFSVGYKRCVATYSDVISLCMEEIATLNLYHT